MTACRIVHAVDHGDRALLTCEAEASGRSFRNTEIHTVRDGKLIAVGSISDGICRTMLRPDSMMIAPGLDHP